MIFFLVKIVLKFFQTKKKLEKKLKLQKNFQQTRKVTAFEFQKKIVISQFLRLIT